MDTFLLTTKSKNPYDEKRLLEQNKRVQRVNNAPEDFPSFVQEGFEVKVVASENFVKRDSGLIYRDFEVVDAYSQKNHRATRTASVVFRQEKFVNLIPANLVSFHYIGYNESGRHIDSTYLQGRPAKIRFGINGLVPGFEEGIGDMRPVGKRRIIIPPELGPHVGPSTPFSTKQFEVFDVELLHVKDCQRRTIGFYSDIVCN
ncbi:hypothetical protein RJ640_010005 [Escallonia rubra]|uniref:peptidylprolyl isomerase n=1 Tax=Escallonia rubra TaxID=112253 RepID=A0AA88U0C8_9ASTE|nr:hypothetical protein RJ640_010005 [Escallonia rubra]